MHDPLSVLVIEDDPAFRTAVLRLLKDRGGHVDGVESLDEARKRLHTRCYDVVLADYELPDGHALELIRECTERGEDTDFVVVTAHDRVELAVDAVKAGAEQFLVKPVEFPALITVLERLARRRRDARYARAARRADEPFLGETMAKEWAYARRIAPRRGHVVIQGETGSGKGVMARWIHDHSQRAGAFVALNCAGLNPNLLESELFGHERGAFTGAHQRKSGLFELARGGTLFLDEIGEMAAASQSKILKAVEEGVYRRVGGTQELTSDVRVIAASHERLSDPNVLRPDLFYRLSTFTIRVLPLRERKKDLPLLVQQLLNQLAPHRTITVSDEALCMMERYPWPGNLRELKNVLERGIALLGDDDILRTEGLRLHDVAPAPGSGQPTRAPSPTLSLKELEADHIQRVVRHHGGNLTRAARVLGISRTTLYKRLHTLSDPRSSVHPLDGPDEASSRS